MKKYAFILVAGLLVFTGKEKSTEGTVEMKVTATLKDEKINKVQAVMSFEDKKTAETMCGIFNLANSMAQSEDDKIAVKCDGKDIEFEDYSSMIADDIIKL